MFFLEPAHHLVRRTKISFGQMDEQGRHHLRIVQRTGAGPRLAPDEQGIKALLLEFLEPVEHAGPGSPHLQSHFLQGMLPTTSQTQDFEPFALPHILGFEKAPLYFLALRFLHDELITWSSHVLSLTHYPLLFKSFMITND